MSNQKLKCALVTGQLITAEEVDQFAKFKDWDLQVVAPKSICEFLTTASFTKGLGCIALDDYDNHPTYMPKLEGVLSAFDLVICKDRLGLYAYQVVKAKRQSGFKLLTWIDNASFLPGEDLPEMRAIRNEVMHETDAFLVQSEEVKATLTQEILLDNELQSKPIYYVSPSVAEITIVEPPSRENARRALDILDNETLILHYGNLEQENGLDDLLQVVARLRQQNGSSIKVALCGYGSHEESLKRKTDTLGLTGSVMFLKPSREAYLTLYHACDAIYFKEVLNQDIADQSPFAILNAMHFAKPLIASRSKVVEELCGKHRLDFCQGSTTSLEKAVLKLIDAAALTADLVQKNRTQLDKKFSPARTSKQLQALLKSVSKLKTPERKKDVGADIQFIDTLIDRDQYIEAIDKIEQIFANQTLNRSEASVLYRQIGDSFCKLGDLDEARKSYQFSLKENPANELSLNGLGTVGLIHQSYDSAIIHFQRAFNLSPENEKSCLGLGLAFQGIEEYHEARKWILHALKLKPQDAASVFSLVRVSHKLGNYQDAIAHLKAYLEAYPDQYDMAYSLAGIYYKVRDYNRAESILQSLLVADAERQDANELLAKIRESKQSSAAKEA